MLSFAAGTGARCTTGEGPMSRVVGSRSRAVASFRRAATASGVLIASALALVGPAVPRVAAENVATDCILPTGGTMGAIDYDSYIRPGGTINAVMLFVDFPDAPAKDPADRLYEDNFAPAVAWMNASSYGKAHF